MFPYRLVVYIYASFVFQKLIKPKVLWSKQKRLLTCLDPKFVIMHLLQLNLSWLQKVMNRESLSALQTMHHLTTNTPDRLQYPQVLLQDEVEEDSGYTLQHLVEQFVCQTQSPNIKVGLNKCPACTDLYSHVAKQGNKTQQRTFRVAKQFRPVVESIRYKNSPYVARTAFRTPSLRKAILYVK